MTSTAAEKLAGRLVADLNFSALEDIKTVGMHQYMDDLQVKLNAIGEAIYKTYLFCPPVILPEPEAPATPPPAPAKAKDTSSAMSKEEAGGGQSQSMGGMKQKQ